MNFRNDYAADDDAPQRPMTMEILEQAIKASEHLNEDVPRCVIIEGIMFWTDGRQPTYENGEPVDGDDAREVLDRYRKGLGIR